MTALITIDGSPTSNDWINSLISGGAWAATGGMVTLSYSLMSGTDPYAYSGIAQGATWNATEAAAIEAAFAVWEAVAKVDFVAAANSGQADLWYWLGSNAEIGSGTLGWHELPGGGASTPLYGAFNREGVGWDANGLTPGGLGFVTLIHEIGHGLGLAHPHDGGLDGELFPGVTSPFGSYGTYSLNQGIYTTMSYNDGWADVPYVSYNYGMQATAMALDIAAIQQIYGANMTYHTGSDSYALPGQNGVGTGWACLWDAGGIDEITAEGSSRNAIINLNDADLTGANAGGYISRLSGVIGGFTIAAGVMIEAATGGLGNDLLIGNEGANTLEGGQGNDTLQGNAGDDWFIAGSGADQIDGGSGNDTTVLSCLSTDVIVAFNSLTNATAITGAGFSVQCQMVERIAFSDVTLTLAVVQPSITGTPAGEVLNGTNVDDVIYGLAGNDKLYGWAGSDLLDGGTGADKMYGGTGNDVYVVDNRQDIIVENPSEGEDSVTTTLSSFVLGYNLENLTYVGSVAFRGTGNTVANTLTGGAGDDSLDGRGGADKLIGGAGDDTYTIDHLGDAVIEGAGGGRDQVLTSVNLAALFAEVEDVVLQARAWQATGNDLANRITGTAQGNMLAGLGGDDSLLGLQGADSLFGGSGADTLVGGNGIDQLTGGLGADAFQFVATGDFGTNLSRADVITDFVQGEDVLDLSLLDASTRLPQNNSFLFNGTAAFGTSAEGEVRYAKVSGSGADYTLVSIDTNSDTRAEYVIKLMGLYDLTAADFLL